MGSFILFFSLGQNLPTFATPQGFHAERLAWIKRESGVIPEQSQLL